MTRKPQKPTPPPPAANAPPRGLHFAESDLLGQLTVNEGSTLWLGRYTVAQIERALERCGLLAALSQQGLGDFIIRIEPFEEFDQALRLYCHAPAPENLIGEARLREIEFGPDTRMPETFSAEPPRMLAINWLLMQNPYATFAPNRPQLPGQLHPGLGQARRVTQLLVDLCRRRRLAGILNFPEYFHNAYLYRDYFHFYDPAREGNLLALHRDLSPMQLADMSWAIEAGCVRLKATGERFEWTSAVQILPVLETISDYFSSPAYRQRGEEVRAAQQFILDQAEYKQFQVSRRE